MPIVNK